MKRDHFSTVTAFVIMLAWVMPVRARESMPLVHPLFSSHTVLQRDANVPVWGWSNPGSKVSVFFSGQRKDAVVDKEGRWQVVLDPMPANAQGQILDVKVNEARREVRIEDVLIGDVWICSGQSNMEMGLGACGEVEEVAQADFPHIRLLTVPRCIAFSPQATMACSWFPCSPDSLTKGVWGGFSAAAYFFGKELHRELGVPVGLIHSSWGGSPCEAWMSGEVLGGLGLYSKELAEVAHVASLPGVQPLHEFMDQWYLKMDPGTQGSWYKPETDVSSWKSATMPATWNDAGLSGHEGIVWVRKEFEIPESWQGRDVQLSLGAIADVDTTWVNGQIVGRCDSYEVERFHKVSAAVLRSGKNVLTMRVMNAGGGGFSAKPEQFHVQVSGGKDAPVSLAGSWRIRASVTRSQTGAPLAGNPGTPSVLYNGMIAPLVPYAIRGAIWYQGESNTGDFIRYRTLLPSMIRDWRTRFGSGDFPFSIVSLANYQPPAGGADNWPGLREVQAMTARKEPKCGLVVAIDIGEAGDIHPKNKREIGRRLALGALANVHGRGIGWSGPWYRSMKRSDNGIRLEFDHLGGGLVARGGDLAGFAIAGDDRKFVEAKAVIDGDSVVVSSSMVRDPVAVRYAWSANPVCNLYNKDGLPAVPFRTDDWSLKEP